MHASVGRGDKGAIFWLRLRYRRALLAGRSARAPKEGSMLEQPSIVPTKKNPPRLPAPFPKKKKEAAKFPPDDADLPAGGTGPAYPMTGGYGSGDDGNFKKGATKPILIVVALLIVIAGVALAIFAVKGETEKMTVDQIAAERKAIAVLPKADQLPKWREWAKRDDVPALQQDAFANLAWAKDDEGLKLIIEHGLGSSDHRLRGTAATAIYDYGSPKADSAKPKLLEILKEADKTDKPQICWALAVLKESGAFDEILSEYRAGNLGSIQKLDGYPAFNPEILAGAVTLDKLASYAGDENDSVRQLVATILSNTADPKWTDTLVKLVQDKDISVAREAAVGLGKIANEATIGPLLAALDKSDKDSRQKFLEALRDGVGAQGLILALRSIQVGHEYFQTKQLFDMLRDLEDPRGGDFLVKYLDTNPLPHWRTEAALRLAEIGDVRAAPHLAWRLRQDPLKLYPATGDNKKDGDNPYLLYAYDDNERVVSARMLADLAVLYPDKRAQLLADAEDATLAWATEHPQPHANALRFLAAAGSQKFLPNLRKWADPALNLPKEGQQDFPAEWATAQSSLRYLGWTKDPSSYGILEKQMSRRPPKVDATMDSLLQGGLSVMGMVLRALEVGASDGIAQWGDPRAYALLTRYIEEPLNNEQSRYEACFALSWVATDDQMKEVAKKVHDFNKPDPKSSLVRSCYLETLIHRPVPAATAGLVDLISSTSDPQVNHQAARAIGFGGLDASIVGKLFDMLKDDALRNDAMLALLIGADSDTTARALAHYNDAPPEAMEELKDTYNRSFGYWSDKNYENGDVARWIQNAEACRFVKVHDALQDWPRMILQRAIQGIEFDNGPHSITRVQFRVRLLNDAKSGDAKKRSDAVAILKFMNEKGVLMALRSEPAPLGDMARQAFFEVMNPKHSVDQKIPDVVGSTAPAGGNVVPPKP
ncbi:hypothetical protein BH09MYX1_BH09MYX1_25400 [soil metagenome]